MYRLPIVEDPSPWIATVRPPSRVCPRRFCFNFVADGSDFAPGLHGSVDEAVQASRRVIGDHCSGSFGRCSRGGLEGDQDLYEPHEPALAREGLPWFYFISDASHVVDDLREAYVTESTALWDTLS